MRAILSLVLLVSSITFIVSCRMNYPVEKPNFKVKEASIAEGKRMTMLICGPCHYNESTKNYSGKKLEDSPAILGKVYASNITQDLEHGIGDYTSGELAYLLKTGLSKDGRLMPYMKRPNLSDEDLQNIIAFLKSDDQQVKASDHMPGDTKYTPVGRLGISMSKPLEFGTERIEKPEDGIELGKYLVDNLACYHCHSKSFPGIDEEDPEASKGYMGGGNRLKDASGKTVRTPNLTFHATGIGNWTQDDFKKALTKGISKDNGIIAYPMPLYPELTDEEIASIFAYLNTVPPIKNEVK